ncbi:Cyclin-D1-binding protein 1 like protein [Chelonia mydas]|uniref:Cyclin-D1-binding protein 1 like protein n=1 Tax=Chelonia mydas TaxID=8469 RepID=M7BJ83_CHEMY|nr:Cyclin-D1-binding protein 1 like protein [Chelonia mydas]
MDPSPPAPGSVTPMTSHFTMGCAETKRVEDESVLPFPGSRCPESRPSLAGTWSVGLSPLALGTVSLLQILSLVSGIVQAGANQALGQEIRRRSPAFGSPLKQETQTRSNKQVQEITGLAGAETGSTPLELVPGESGSRSGATLIGVRARPELNGVRARAPLTAACFRFRSIFANFCALGFRPQGESRESSETFEQQRFWDTLGQTFKATSQEATKLSLAFSRPPLPSAEDCQKLSEGVQNAVLAAATVYYWLPKGQGTTLRKMVRDATAEVVEGMIQLTDVILSTPLQSLSQEQLISTGSIWEACEQISHLPQDNHAAVLSAMAAYLGVVRDAVEEMEQAQREDQDPYSDIMEDEELGSRGNRDTYWSEADRKLLSPCMGLMKASKACLKKLLGAVKLHGKADTPEQVAQLDDLADITNEISPSVDELALSMYPPMNQLSVRLNGLEPTRKKRVHGEGTWSVLIQYRPVYAQICLTHGSAMLPSATYLTQLLSEEEILTGCEAMSDRESDGEDVVEKAAKLASVLKKVLEITKASHVCPPSEEGWVQFLTGAVDHNMDKIKDFTQSEL